MTISNEVENAVEKNSSTILRVVPFESGFHFSTEKGTYVGVTATSFEDFALKLRSLDTDSLAYHYYRGDFQRWIDNTLGDVDFANRLCFVKRNLSGEQLRLELLSMLDSRIRELRGLKWIETEGI